MTYEDRCPCGWWTNARRFPLRYHAEAHRCGKAKAEIMNRARAARRAMLGLAKIAWWLGTHDARRLWDGSEVVL